MNEVQFLYAQNINFLKAYSGQAKFRDTPSQQHMFPQHTILLRNYQRQQINETHD
jgi:hypothetical protein